MLRRTNSMGQTCKWFYEVIRQDSEYLETHKNMHNGNEGVGLLVKLPKLISFYYPLFTKKKQPQNHSVSKKTYFWGILNFPSA